MSSVSGRSYRYRILPKSAVPSTSAKRTSWILHLHEADVTDFAGDVLINSTSSRLEGTQRKNWWGFAGRKSADAALHAKFEEKGTAPDLRAACLQALSGTFAELREGKAAPAGEVHMPVSFISETMRTSAVWTSSLDTREPESRMAAVVRNWFGKVFGWAEEEVAKDHDETNWSGSHPRRGYRGFFAAGVLPMSHIVHVALPNHPESPMASDPRPLTAEYASDFAKDVDSGEAALHDVWLRAFTRICVEVEDRRGWLQKGAPCPRKRLLIGASALGCGTRGYPPDVAAKIALEEILSAADRTASCGAPACASQRNPNSGCLSLGRDPGQAEERFWSEVEVEVEIRFWSTEILLVWRRIWNKDERLEESS